MGVAFDMCSTSSQSVRWLTIKMSEPRVFPLRAVEGGALKYRGPSDTVTILAKP
jgi:hypothetical protein